MNLQIARIKKTEEILRLYPEAGDKASKKIKKNVQRDLHKAKRGNRIVFYYCKRTLYR